MSTNYNLLPLLGAEPDDGFNEIRASLNQIVNSDKNIDRAPVSADTPIDREFKENSDFTVINTDILLEEGETVEIDCAAENARIPSSLKDTFSQIEIINYGYHFALRAHFVSIKIDLPGNPLSISRPMRKGDIIEIEIANEDDQPEHLAICQINKTDGNSICIGPITIKPNKFES